MTIWYHQPQTLVRAWGQSVPAARRKFARLQQGSFANIRGRRHRAQLAEPPLPGTSTFVVELAPGGLSDRGREPGLRGCGSRGRFRTSPQSGLPRPPEARAAGEVVLEIDDRRASTTRMGWTSRTRARVGLRMDFLRAQARIVGTLWQERAARNAPGFAAPRPDRLRTSRPSSAATGPAHRAAYLVVHDAAAAEDIAQEAFLVGRAGPRRLRPPAAFGPWLHRIVVNRAIDWTRARACGARSETNSTRSTGAEGAAPDDLR